MKKKLSVVQYEVIVNIVQGVLWLIIGIVSIAVPRNAAIAEMIDIMLAIALLAYIAILAVNCIRGKEKADEMAYDHMKTAESYGYLIIQIMMFVVLVCSESFDLFGKIIIRVELSSILLIILGLSSIITGCIFVVLEREVLTDAED